MTPGAVASMLPEPTPQMRSHEARVRQALYETIRAANGWVPFDDYLRIVQYAPGLGYYSAGSHKIGVEGDFTTAPELSPLFGRCVAQQSAQVLERCGGDVLELGAGSGVLAASLLQSLQDLERLPEHYFILEISADLRERQRRRLMRLPHGLYERVRWLDSLPNPPIRGLFIANEVIDALPFKRFAIAETGAVLERGVAVSDELILREGDRAAGDSLRSEVMRVGGASVHEWPAGYSSEVCLMVGPWIASLATSLARGAMLLIDYGYTRREYYHPQRWRGTLRCHFQHRAHDDALLYPGLQDISAWVDFTRVAEGADAAGLEVAGFCTQTAFLLANGIEQALAAERDPLEHAKLASQARVLLLPGEMGEAFKVMALTRGLTEPLHGFVHQDLRGSL
jgi:SAM-dependent MidA family methyltransferase